MKVLLVDDSSTMRKIQKRMLIAMDITDITEAGNGKEALIKLKEANYEFTFILCDINMPEMSGMETLKKIRSMPQTEKLPVIMCTSVAEKSQVMEAIKAGASNYIVKPFKAEDLEEKVNAVLGR
ncbi:MAG: response regulator [Lentisphaeria bacterium]|nr:response regulator [Lentisphaeria bacterium]